MPSQRYERVPSVVVEDTNLGETNPPRYDDLPDKPCDAPSPFSKKYTSDDPTGLDLNLSLDITHVTRNATVVRVLADRVVQLEVKLTGRNANESKDADIESLTWSKWKEAPSSERIIAVIICLMVILSLALFFGGIAWAIYNVV